MSKLTKNPASMAVWSSSSASSVGMSWRIAICAQCRIEWQTKVLTKSSHGVAFCRIQSSTLDEEYSSVGSIVASEMFVRAVPCLARKWFATQTCQQTGLAVWFCGAFAIGSCTAKAKFKVVFTLIPLLDASLMTFSLEAVQLRDKGQCLMFVCLIWHFDWNICLPLVNTDLIEAMFWFHLKRCALSPFLSIWVCSGGLVGHMCDRLLYFFLTIMNEL